MLKHVVLMRMKSESSVQKELDLKQLIGALEALPNTVAQIEKLDVVRNLVDRPGNWDLALTVEVSDADALEQYRTHPEHLKVASLIDHVVADRCAVDSLH